MVPHAPATSGAAATSSPKAKAPKAPKAKAASKPKTPSNHPAYGDMIKKAITTLANKKGSSRSAILKYVLQNYNVGSNIVQVNAKLRQALKRGVTSGSLKQVKGVGASGSFRLGDKTSPAPKTKKSPSKPKSPVKKSTVKPKTAKAAPKAKAPAKPKKSPVKKVAASKSKVVKSKSPIKTASKGKKTAKPTAAKS